MSSQGPLTREEHLPIINAALAEAQAIMDDCAKSERCRIDVRKQKGDIEDALAFLQTIKAEHFPDES